MSDQDQRPLLGVAHVVLEAMYQGPEVSVFELRGGTHLILMLKSKIAAGNAPFDLMVDDLHATH